MTGIEALLEILAAAKITHLFGNPGTTELPLNAALAHDPRFRYHFGIQEIPVVAMADGYTMASGRPSVVNVHVSCGLGNAMGMLYNAHCEGTPLIVTAGQQDRRLRLGEPVLDGDLVSVARPWTKWSYEVQRVDDIPTALRRAIQIALTPPTGPVFLSLPLDVQMETITAPDLSPPTLVDRRVRPPLDALRSAAKLLAGAKRPVILAGSRVTESDGCNELAALAEQIGAPVFAEGTTSHGRLPMRSDHPLYRSVFGYWSSDIRAQLEPYDVVLAVGLNLFRLYIHREPECPLPEHARVIHLDSSPHEIGKNYPIELGLWGDPKSGLAELSELLSHELTADARAAAASRCETYAAERQVAQAELRRTIAEQQSARPLTPLAFMGALATALPDNTAVVEEAITTHQNVLEKLGVIRDPAAHFAHRGWALGWGLGCALGVKLAWPDRPVLGLLGDGSALYGIQGLWSAAHHQIPVTFVIANNRQYKILKVCGDVLALPELREPRCPGINITGPNVDFVGLAQSFGVEAERISDPDELTAKLRASLTGDRPRLIEVPIAE
jgi:benzoylformate decarboxylase